MTSVRRGAPPTLLVDETPLNGPRIDVARRIGWLLRMARTDPRRADRPNMQDMADKLGTSLTQIHRIETGHVRMGEVANGYERVLGLLEGSLRAPVDVVCRAFPHSPPDRRVGPQVETVDEMSALTEAVAADATGGTWLRWARALAQPGAIGLPRDLATTLVDRLAGEVGRAVGTAYASRLEALSLVRCSGYGDVVLEVAQARASDPHIQVMLTLMGAVGERVSDETVAWCLDLLGDPRPMVVVGASLGLERMAKVSGDPGFWEPYVDALIDRLDSTDDDPMAWEWVSHVLRLVPAAIVTGTGRRPARALAPTARIHDWSRSDDNEHWQEAGRRSAAVARAGGIGEQPMLTRLLFELMCSPFETRALASGQLLGALPHLGGPAAEQLLEVAADHPDPVVRERAGRRVLGLVRAGGHPGTLEAWLLRGRPLRCSFDLRVAGLTGLPVSDQLLDEVIVTDPGAATYLAGLIQHPRLQRWAADPGLSSDVRGAAQWWRTEGGRIVDLE